MAETPSAPSTQRRPRRAHWIFALLGAMAGLAACAPTVQQAVFAVQPAAIEPRFEEGRFVSFDGAVLGLQTWGPDEGAEPWAVIIALHGMNDYSEAFFLAGPYWARHGIRTYAYDARGHGRSPRRGVWGGEALMTQDLRTAVGVARRMHPDAILAVVGDSMGAATAIAAFGSQAPPAADRLVLAAPAVWGWSSLPRMYAAALWVSAHTIPAREVSPPRAVQRRIRPSDNEEMLAKIGQDPLMVFETRVDAVYGLVSLMETAAQRLSAVQTPTAFLYGANDQIIPRDAALEAAGRLPQGALTALYRDGYHMLLRDRGRESVLGDIVAFLRDPAQPPPSGAEPLRSNRLE